MSDTLTEGQRRLNMSRIRGRDTKPEITIRQGLHARGMRFRLYRKDLPGKPDLTLSKYRVVIFVHGCFWHGHGCPLFVWPKTRKVFWKEKIERNIDRDRRAAKLLKDRGWRVLTIWECSLKGPHRLALDEILDLCEYFMINATEEEMDILGNFR